MIDTIKPLNNKLIIKVIEEETITESGIIKPYDPSSRLKRGVIISRSARQKEEGKARTQTKVGFIVIFDPHFGIKIDDQHLFIDEENILGFFQQN